MPKNSELHAVRMAKVKQGFTAARLTTVQVNQIMGVFDVLTAPLATEVAQRTEFSVSTSSKASESIFGKGRTEERRQMARALLFVSDLTNLFDAKPLSKKTTDGEFENVWRGDFDRLALQLTKSATSLCEADVQFREILSRPVVVAVRPTPRRIVIPDETRSLLTKTVTNQRLRLTDVGGPRTGAVQISPLTIHKAAWTDAKVGLVAVFATVVNAQTSNMMAVQNAAASAYTEFEAFFREVGKENEAKIAMAKSLFDALASHAPFPLSIVGKIGAAAIGLAHADTAITQTRELGPPKYFDTNIPTLEKFNAKLGAVKSWTSDLTRLGVDGGAMPSGTSIRTAIDTARSRTVVLLNKLFVDAINETYGAGPDDTANKGTQFYEKVLEGLGGGVGARPELIAQMAINKTTVVFNATKMAIESAGTASVVTAAEIQPFIELQLMAVYLAAFIPDENFTKAIPDGLIKRLESAPFELVQRKTSSGQTNAIYAAKKLPWISGHPRHVGALVYFFRWYAKSVNPFDLATGKVTVKALRDAMDLAIAEIGKAVQAHKVTRTFRSADTADWTRVAGDVARIRGV